MIVNMAFLNSVAPVESHFLIRFVVLILLLYISLLQLK